MYYWEAGLPAAIVSFATASEDRYLLCGQTVNPPTQASVDR